MLSIALLRPASLGPTYELSRVRGEVEAVVPRAVALPGKQAQPGDENAEWPDASRLAVQIKKVRIEVVSVVVRPLEIAQTPKKKLTKESYLVLRLRVHQPAGGAEFASDRWGAGGTAQQRYQPVLTDERGKVCQTAADPGGEAVRAGAAGQRIPARHHR